VGSYVLSRLWIKNAALPILARVKGKNKLIHDVFPQAQKYTATSDDQVFGENELGKTREGKNLSTYRELCSLASDLNQPDLIYKYDLKACDGASTAGDTPHSPVFYRHHSFTSSIASVQFYLDGPSQPSHSYSVPGS
jgi:hypothetical protein